MEDGSPWKPEKPWAASSMEYQGQWQGAQFYTLCVTQKHSEIAERGFVRFGARV